MGGPGSQSGRCCTHLPEALPGSCRLRGRSVTAGTRREIRNMGSLHIFLLQDPGIQAGALFPRTWASGGPQLSLLSDHRVLPSNRIQESRLPLESWGSPSSLRSRVQVPRHKQKQAPPFPLGSPPPNSTSQRGLFQPREQSRLSEFRQQHLASSQGSQSLYRPWVLRGTLCPAGTGHVGGPCGHQGF